MHELTDYLALVLAPDGRPERPEAFARVMAAAALLSQPAACGSPAVMLRQQCGVSPAPPAHTLHFCFIENLHIAHTLAPLFHQDAPCVVAFRSSLPLLASCTITSAPERLGGLCACSPTTDSLEHLSLGALCASFQQRPCPPSCGAAPSFASTRSSTHISHLSVHTPPPPHPSGHALTEDMALTPRAHGLWETHRAIDGSESEVAGASALLSAARPRQPIPTTSFADPRFLHISMLLPKTGRFGCVTISIQTSGALEGPGAPLGRC